MGMGSLPDGYSGGLTLNKGDDPPDECESSGCDRSAEWKVVYREPEETVYYCEQCALRHSTEDDKAGPAQKIT